MNLGASRQKASLIFRVKLAYRVNALVGQAAPILIFLLMMSLLRYGGLAIPADERERLVAYYFLVTIISGAVLPMIWSDVFREIRTGKVAFALVRPYSYVEDLVYGGISSSVFNVLTGLLTAMLLYPLVSPSLTLKQIGMFLFALIPAITLSTLISALLSLSGFWLVSESGPAYFVWYLGMFTSGAIVPVNLMPKWAQVASNLLPFRYLVDFPLRACLGLVSQSEVYTGLLVQAAWITAILCLLSLIWRKGLKHLTLGGM